MRTIAATHREQLHRLDLELGDLEAHDRGYWNPDEEILEGLRDLVDNLERKLEGVA